MQNQNVCVVASEMHVKGGLGGLAWGSIDERGSLLAAVINI